MKLLNFLSIFAMLFLVGCGAGGTEDGTTNLTESKYERARLLDFSKTNDYEVITGSKEATALRSLSTKSSGTDQTASSWMKIAAMISKPLKAKRYSTRSVTDDGDSVVYENREYGDVSGYVDMRLVVNKSDGSFSGSMNYYNFKNSENGICSSDHLSIDGELKIYGVYDIYEDIMEFMTMQVFSDTTINDITFKDNFSIKIEYRGEDSAILTLNGDIEQFGKNYGFKEYKLNSYTGEEYRYSYSYPMSGNIYIFSDNIDGYFYVDESYPHHLTPTKSDMCQEHFYAGKERYIGDNGVLTFEIDEQDHYIITIDYDNDSTIDKTIEGRL